MLKNGFGQYADICTDAIRKSGAKVTKRIEKILIEVLILYMDDEGDWHGLLHGFLQVPDVQYLPDETYF